MKTSAKAEEFPAWHKTIKFNAILCHFIVRVETFDVECVGMVTNSYFTALCLRLESSTRRTIKKKRSNSVQFARKRHYASLFVMKQAFPKHKNF